MSVPALAFIGLALMKEAGLDNQANASWAVVRVVEIFAWVTGFGDEGFAQVPGSGGQRFTRVAGLGGQRFA